MKKTKTKKTPALTCGDCPHFDRRAGWCKVGATWRTADSAACVYGAMVMAKAKKAKGGGK